MTVQYLSQEKYDELVAERKQLKLHDMLETAKRIDDAKQMGDLSENAEYHAAREQLAWQQSRVKEIDHILEHAEIVRHSGSTYITVGSVVEVEVGGTSKTYTLVGAQEADPLSGRISNESPIGMALMGKSQGDEVVVDLPAGKQTYKVTVVS